MNFDDIDDRIRAALAEATRLPGRDIDHITELITVGEQGMALEDLCTQLYEYDIAVRPATVRNLAEAGEATGLDARQ